MLERALPPDARVLDAGCGRRSRLADHRERIGELVGVDIDAEACAANASMDRVVVADLCGPLPFPDGSFDLVYTNFVVEHLSAPADAFAEWRRVLKPDGALILLTSNLANPALAIGHLIPRSARLRLKRSGAGVADEDVVPTRYRANTPRRLDTLLVRAGFRPVVVQHVATLHRYAARAPRLATLLRLLEPRLPPALCSTIVAWYRAA